MRRQTLEFAVTRKNGTVTEIGRGAMFRPKPGNKNGQTVQHTEKTRQPVR